MSFEHSKSKKNNTWNIRRLVDDSFVPSSQRPSVNISEIDGFLLFHIRRLFKIQGKLHKRNSNALSEIISPQYIHAMCKLFGKWASDESLRIIKKTPLRNGNSPNMEPITKMGVAQR